MNRPITVSRIAYLFAVTAMWALLATPSVADQNDPRLDRLFAELKLAARQESADQIASEIWALWRETKDPVAAQALADGIQAMRTRQYRNAYQHFSEVIRQAPAFAEGWNARATVLYLMGAYRESIDDIRETLQREPRHFGALSGLGLIFLHQKQLGPAATAFRDALSINPHLPRIRATIEQLESRQKSIDEKKAI